MHKIAVALICLLLKPFCVELTGQNDTISTSRQYVLDLKFVPDSGYIEGTAEIKDPDDSVFYLTKGLTLQSLSADGKRTGFRSTDNRDVPNSEKYSIDNVPGKLIIHFSGRIDPALYPKTIGALSMVNDRLIELSDHIDWYPRFERSAASDFIVSVDLPGSYTAVTNLERQDEKKLHQRVITQWRSEKPVYNLTLIAAPGFKIRNSDCAGYHLEICYTSLPGTYIDSMLGDLCKTVKLYTDLYGTDGAGKQVRIVYSPRSAGGYARAPLLIVSEKFALEQRTLKYGFARDYRLNAHELAHYWSRADVNTADDWINEGLAEFSALLASEKIIGKEFSDVLLDEYKGIVNSTQTEVPIMETTSGSWEREINRYYRPTLLFHDIRETYGDSMLFEFVKRLYENFTEKQSATTAVVLETLGDCFGVDEKEKFNEALFKVPVISRQSKNVQSDFDTLMIGAWVGQLTQFGQPAKFVLNLRNVDGKIVPTLDSPDQNAFDIPVTDLKIDNDSVFFVLGMAGATFTGSIDRSHLSIDGTWKQRGVDYPLFLKKEDTE